MQKSREKSQKVLAFDFLQSSSILTKLQNFQLFIQDLKLNLSTRARAHAPTLINN